MDLTIRINNTFRPGGDDAPFSLPCRVLWLDEKNDSVVLISIEAEPKQPWLYSLSSLTGLLRDHKIMRVEMKVPDFMLALEDEITEKQKAIRETSWERIRDLVADPGDGRIFHPGSMGSLIQVHATRLGLQRKSLYRLLYRYWMLGSVRNALLPQYTNSGAKGTTRQYSSGMLPGRPPRTPDPAIQVRAKVLSEQDKAIIKIGYALYKDSAVKTIADAYTRTLRHYYCEAVMTPDFPDQPVLKPLEELPTQRQFEYWGKKAFDDITVLRGRKGERKWAKDHRSLRGRAGQGLMGPCQRFEIDATIADIYLVSRYNRNWIIGRPVVYVVVDVFSRMIAGLYVGLEGPSWEGARQALLNAFSEKTAFCAEHEIHIQHADWPCAHLPQELCADRGEMLGLAAEGIVSGLGIDLAIAPPYRPDWKAVVESRFRILNQLTQVHWTPGGVAERIKERGDRDYRLDATMDLKQFTKIMISSVLHYNLHTRQPDLLNQDMIATGIDATPLAIWNWGIDHGFGTPNEQVAELVRLHLMAKSSRTVQAGGIFFAGMFYIAEDGSDESRYSRARARGREAIDVWHDSTDPQCIWIRAADKSLKRCVLRASEVRYRDRRLEEILDMLQMVKFVSPGHRHTTLADKVRLDEYIQTTISGAVAEKKDAGKPDSKAAQLANIRHHRAIERLTERVAATPVVPPATATPAAGKAELSVSESFGARGAEVIDILSQLRKRTKHE
jgi:putative transposase